jgi:AraC-like DNA-binding protein
VLGLWRGCLGFFVNSAEVVAGVGLDLGVLAVRSLAGRSAVVPQAASRRSTVSSVLSGPVRFDAEQSALVFPTSKLECPVPGADPRQRVILEASVAKYWSDSLPNVTDQVVRILRPRVLFGDFTLETVAHCLTMHPRTLNRHLKAEGMTFRKLLNETRFEVARQLLVGTRINITGAAAALGYADTSVFSHAFRRMAGAPPLEWRAGSTAAMLTSYEKHSRQTPFA